MSRRSDARDKSQLLASEALEGLKAVLTRGRKGGRRPKLTEDDKKAAHAMLAAGDISVAEIARRLGISRMTFYDYFPPGTGKITGGQSMNDVYLTRVDASQNMARFYHMIVQPTLFGEWSLVREWGRTGRGGQVPVWCPTLLTIRPLRPWLSHKAEKSGEGIATESD